MGSVALITPESASRYLGFRTTTLSSGESSTCRMLSRYRLQSGGSPGRVGSWNKGMVVLISKLEISWSHLIDPDWVVEGCVVSPLLFGFRYLGQLPLQPHHPLRLFLCRCGRAQPEEGGQVRQVLEVVAHVLVGLIKKCLCYVKELDQAGKGTHTYFILHEKVLPG